MLRRSFLKLILLIVLVPVQANASSLYDEKVKYEQELNDTMKLIDNVENKKELVQLKRKENELAKYVRAYDKAIEYNANSDTITLSGVESATDTMHLLNNDDNPPSKYIDIYKAAAKKYNIDWTILAAIHKIETSYSTDKIMISSAGALGHMQFMPATWNYYGVDANGDGVADPYNIHDAVFSAGNYLSASGLSDGLIDKALFSYNHSMVYVNDVKRIAETIKESFSENNIKVVDVGKKFIGNSSYVFGSGRNDDDIKAGRFDCSSYVHWAYDQVGIRLGDRTSVTTDTLKVLGVDVPYSDIRVGDLVFFDTYKKDGHVGIYAGNGKFIGAQSSTGVAVADMTSGYWKDKFNGRIKRIK